jgi:hypothetical protein
MPFDPRKGPGCSAAGPVSGRSIAGVSEMRERTQQGVGATIRAITQADLERLAAVNEQQKHLKQEYKALRDSLLERYGEGASVEPGYLDIDVLRSEQRQFSFDALVRILGKEKTEQLRELLTPKTQFRVTVIKSR